MGEEYGERGGDWASGMRGEGRGREFAGSEVWGVESSS